MAEKKVKVPFPTPASPLRDGTEVGVSESVERWSEVTLEDKTVLKIKVSVLSATRIDGEWDNDGNPTYAIKMQPIIAVAGCDEGLRRRTN